MEYNFPSHQKEPRTEDNHMKKQSDNQNYLDFLWQAGDCRQGIHYSVMFLAVCGT
jgi:hypothetical protein